jgi:hypothetical protein
VQALDLVSIEFDGAVASPEPDVGVDVQHLGAASLMEANDLCHHPSPPSPDISPKLGIGAVAA